MGNSLGSPIGWSPFSTHWVQHEMILLERMSSLNSTAYFKGSLALRKFMVSQITKFVVVSLNGGLSFCRSMILIIFVYKGDKGRCINKEVFHFFLP